MDQNGRPKLLHKVVDKAADATADANDKIVKPKPLSTENSINVEEIVIPPEKRQEILKDLRQLL